MLKASDPNSPCRRIISGFLIPGGLVQRFLFEPSYYLSIGLMRRWHRSGVVLLLGFTDREKPASHRPEPG